MTLRQAYPPPIPTLWRRNHEEKANILARSSQIMYISRDHHETITDGACCVNPKLEVWRCMPKDVCLH